VGVVGEVGVLLSPPQLHKTKDNSKVLGGNILFIVPAFLA
jgi:hypothetical protein